MKEQSLFIEFMGDSPKIRIIDYLLTMGGLDFSITDMAENARIGRATLYRIWDNLIKYNVIIHTRDIGNAKLYKLNMRNPQVPLLIEMFDRAINAAFHEERLDKERVLRDVK